jgi:hypothetical protein
MVAQPPFRITAVILSCCFGSRPISSKYEQGWYDDLKAVGRQKGLYVPVHDYPFKYRPLDLLLYREDFAQPT